MAPPIGKISQKILKDHYNALVFGQGRGSVYLVGGYLRDILIGKRSNDRDYVFFGDIRTFVEGIQKITGGSVVVFRKENLIRIALKGGGSLDFSRPQGSIQEDLSGRDYTVNAIAWSPQSGIVDIFKGLDDINNRIVRCISGKNFIADPLRMLRAYRIAAELDASIELKTRLIIKQLQNSIKKIPYERITLEFFKLLNSNRSAKYLKMALRDGILSNILSINYSQLERSIRAISHIEKAYINMLPRSIKVLLNRNISQDITYKGLLCLEIMLKDSGAYDLPRHTLNLSNFVRKRLQSAVKGIHELKKSGYRKETLFDAFMNAGESSIDSLIILNKLDILRDYYRFRRVWKLGFLSSREIIDIADIKEGPELGSIILMIKKAQFTGELMTRKQAERFVKKLGSRTRHNLT